MIVTTGQFISVEVRGYTLWCDSRTPGRVTLTHRGEPIDLPGQADAARVWCEAYRKVAALDTTYRDQDGVVVGLAAHLHHDRYLFEREPRLRGEAEWVRVTREGVTVKLPTGAAVLDVIAGYLRVVDAPMPYRVRESENPRSKEDIK